MKLYIPKAYPDELLYSQLARHYAEGGYISALDAVRSLYGSVSAKPDIELINKMSPEAVEALTVHCSMEAVVLNNTMFPRYGRFLSKEMRKQAFDELVHMNGNYNHHISVPKQRRSVGRHLRYCPLCAAADRERYGETYWHRTAQLFGIYVCPEHHCYYVETDNAVYGTKSYLLIPAEIAVGDNKQEPEISRSEWEIRNAEFQAEVFHAPLDLDREADIGEFLRSRLDPRYRNSRGTIIDAEAVYRDFCKNVSQPDPMTFTDFRRTLAGKKALFDQVCQIALFEGITAEEMLTVPNTVRKAVDREVYLKVAEELGVDIETVSRIGAAVLKRYRGMTKVQKLRSEPIYDWQKRDQELYPLVQEEIRRLKQAGEMKPEKISVTKIAQTLGHRRSHFDRMPMCKELIRSNRESLEEFRARKTVWAYRKMVSEGRTVTLYQLERAVRMDRKEFETCKPYLGLYTDDRDLIDRIREL